MQTNQEPDTYVVTFAVFGDHPARNIPTIALCKTMELGKKRYSKAAYTVLDNTYVDDIVDRVTSVTDAKQYSKNIDALSKKGSF